MVVGLYLMVLLLMVYGDFFCVAWFCLLCCCLLFWCLICCFVFYFVDCCMFTDLRLFCCFGFFCLILLVVFSCVVLMLALLISLVVCVYCGLFPAGLAPI